jgi:DNA-binding IclR family transcriptional regulator
MSLTELFRQVGLNKSTTLNILATLVDLGFVSVDDETRQYRLGPRLLELGAAFEASFEIAKLAEPSLARVRDATKETASLHVRIGWERTCVAQAVGSHAIRRVVEIGRRRPLYSGAAGAILLGDLPPDEIKEYVARTKLAPFTPRTITSKRELLSMLESTKKSGFVAVFEDTEVGVAASGVPIRDHTGRVLAALVVSGPSTRFDKHAVKAALPAMRMAADEISKHLGWSPKKNQLKPTAA